ncbi:MAG: hypothetical protein A2360_01400 [Candidatus Staskawiczbacteria bacterium RIFOXYB1_FULL_32_11]|nr:MAG: hypothetical protein A2360_01400 [Candidatus Staskawiczbacteria bacterium RIFOXYB1_FULL_32_11]
MNFGTAAAGAVTLGKAGQNTILNGKVGIGTTDPLQSVHTTGTLFINGADETITSSISETPPGFTDAGLFLGYDTTNRKGFLRSVAWGTDFSPLYFQAQEFRWSTYILPLVERMVLDVNGKLGIATASPLTKLDARRASAKATTAAFENIIQAASSDAANPLTLRMGIKTDATATNRYGAIEVDDAGVKRNLALQAGGGKVGIGTTTPRGVLDLSDGELISKKVFAPGADRAAADLSQFYTSVEHGQGSTFSGQINALADITGDTVAPYHAAVGGTPSDAKNVYALIGMRSGISAWNADFTSALSTGNYLPGLGFAGQTDSTSGTGTVIGASINAVVDGAVSSGNLPTAIVMHTSATNSGGLSERLRITSAGRVGIGTTSPTARLHTTSLANSKALQIDGYSLTGSDASSMIDLSGTWNTTGSPILINANLTDTASASGSLLMALAVNSGDKFTVSRDGDIVSAGTVASYGYRFMGNYGVGVDADNFGLVFNVGNGTFTEAMRIISSGKVGIGKSDPSYALDVVGDINSSTGLRVAGTQVCTSAGCTSSSDLRLKQEIEPLNDSLENILKLQGVSYSWKNPEVFGNGKQIGLIAQDLEKVYPEVVVTDQKTGLRSVAYGHLVSPLIEAVKTLAGHVQELFRSADHQARGLASVESKVMELQLENAAKQKEITDLKHENAAIKAYLCGKDPVATFCK